MVGEKADRHRTSSLPLIARRRGMTALTHVELVWVKDRIEKRIRFGPIAERHVLDRSRQLVSFEHPAAFLPSFVGPRTISAPPFRGSISCAPLQKASAIRPFLVFGLAARFCCVSLAGESSKACYRQLISSRRSGSIRRTLRPSIGATSTTVCS